MLFKKKKTKKTETVEKQPEPVVAPVTFAPPQGLEDGELRPQVTPIPPVEMLPPEMRNFSPLHTFAPNIPQVPPVTGSNPIADKFAMEQEEKTHVVNCYKCGAALQVKKDNVAYMCPVCRTLFRMRTDVRLIDESLPAEIKLTLSDRAAEYVLKTEKERIAAQAETETETETETEKPAPTLESLLAEKLNPQNYREGDVFMIDLFDGKLVISTARKVNE